MKPPQDYLNLRYALENNIQTIHFSSSLDPIVTPVAPVEFCVLDIVSYMDFFETADASKSTEPMVVEYYKLKHRLKSFETIVQKLEGTCEAPEFFPLQINDFVTNGAACDLYIAAFAAGEHFMCDRERDALRFFEEARRVAMRWCNQDGVSLCTSKIAKIREDTGLGYDGKNASAAL